MPRSVTSWIHSSAMWLWMSAGGTALPPPSTALAGLKPQKPHSHTALLLQDPKEYLCEQYLRQPVLLEQHWLHLWHSQCTARLSRCTTVVGALGGKPRHTSYIQLYADSLDVTWGLDLAFCPPGFLLLFPLDFNFKSVEENFQMVWVMQCLLFTACACRSLFTSILKKSAFPCVLLELRCT